MAGARQGLLHQYTSRLTAFEHTPSSDSRPQNLIIFIGGLFDGLLTVPYATTLASALPSTWSLANILLSSSYNQWGTSSLQKDVRELSKAVTYFRSIKTGKIILMGHSTGCQDVMEYLTGAGHETRPPIDGGIIQAPVSDREAFVSESPSSIYEQNCRFAQQMVDEGKGDEVLPSSYSKALFSSNAPVTANRFLSLTSPNHDGDDDYFSSDLSDQQLSKTFGSLPRRSPLLILYSGADEYVPSKIDKKALIGKWIARAKKGEGTVDEVHSGILEGGSHNLKGSDAAIEDLIKRTIGFLNGLTELANL